MAIVLEAKKGALTPEFKAQKYARVNINGIIDAAMADRVVKEIDQAVEMNDATPTADTPSKCIFIFIHSQGGWVPEMARIVEAINRAKRYNLVATVVDTTAFSAAVPIFCCGHDGFRFVAENAQFMIHHAILTEASGDGACARTTMTSHQVRDAGAAASARDPHRERGVSTASSEDLQHLQAMQKRLEQLITVVYAKNKTRMFTKFTSDLEKHRHVDWFISPKELLRYGIANHIGVPDYMHDFTYTPKLLLKDKKAIAIPLASDKSRAWK